MGGALLEREGEGGVGGVGWVSLGGALHPTTTAFSPWEAPNTAFTQFLLFNIFHLNCPPTPLSKHQQQKQTKITQCGGNTHLRVEF